LLLNEMSDSASWTPLHAQLHRTLKVRQLLPSGQRLLVAVSGGQDSLCLIKLLLDLQPKWGWDLAIAHCDHGWRSDSADNAKYIKQLAQFWQVLFYGKTAEINEAIIKLK
jgi:tRNA(Ile)-lysidine synthase